MTKKHTVPLLTDVSAISERLRKARVDAKLTQAALAKRAGLGRSAVIHYEQGNAVPGGLELIKLAKALCRSPNFLLGGDESFFESPEPELSLARTDEALHQRITICLMVLDREVRERVSALLIALVRAKKTREEFAQFLEAMNTVEDYVAMLRPNIDAAVDTVTSEPPRRRKRT
jgi:transcriptional regulator with XRE-family HTH domain